MKKDERKAERKKGGEREDIMCMTLIRRNKEEELGERGYSVDDERFK